MKTLGILTVIALSFVAQEARGQACCSATSAGEAGVVGRCHKAMLQLGMGIDHGLAAFDSDQARQRFESSSSEDIIFMLAGGIRPIDRRFRVGAMVPMHLQHRGSEAVGSTRTGVGDVGWSTGFLVLEDSMLGLSHSVMPFFEVVAMGTLPTGTHIGESSDPLGADVTSNGATTLGSGLRVIKFVTSTQALRVQGDYRYSFEYDTPMGSQEVSVQPGAEWSALGGWMYEGSIFWSTGLYVRYSFQENLRTNGETIRDSSRERLVIGGTYRQSLAFPFWDLNIALGSDMLMGKNVPRVGVSGSLNIQRNFL